MQRQTAGGGAQASAGGGSAGGAGGSSGGGAADAAAVGKQTFTGAGGCGACHTLGDAGTSGTTGPDLDKYLKGKSAAFIKTSIVSPNAYVEKGYAPNVMPQNFGQQLSPAQINGLVAYLQKVTK
jgi:mono/diheme cytochrome c family protein